MARKFIAAAVVDEISVKPLLALKNLERCTVSGKPP
jgi:hypothetical protein